VGRWGIEPEATGDGVSLSGLRRPQFGEDGVVDHALSLLGVEDGYVVEFGAGDGLELSNTAQFWRDRGWQALLIEADHERYTGLKVNTRTYDRVAICNATIQPTGNAMTIDNFVLGGRAVDFMSIDVDDGDYQIFKHMRIQPKLVLCEFNYTMPHDRIMVGALGSRLQSSPLALVDMAATKGYTLICVSGCNCLFVRDDLADVFADFEQRLDKLVDPAALTYVVTDWLGNYIIVGCKPHGISDNCVDPPWDEP